MTQITDIYTYTSRYLRLTAEREEIAVPTLCYSCAQCSSHVEKRKRAQAELPSFYYRNYTTCPAAYTGCALVNSVVGSVIYPSYIKADSNKWTVGCRAQYGAGNS